MWLESLARRGGWTGLVPFKNRFRREGLCPQRKFGLEQVPGRLRLLRERMLDELKADTEPRASYSAMDAPGLRNSCKNRIGRHDECATVALAITYRQAHCVRFEARELTPCLLHELP
jgi:hypothetical protein